MLFYVLMFKRIAFILLSVALITLGGCGDSKPKRGEGAGKYGMIDPNTPHYAAMQFFDHIYYDKTLKGAMSLSTPRLAKLLKSYHTNRNVQRHVLNLTYDEVEIQPDAGNSVARSEFSQKAVVTIFFTGTRHGDKFEDIRIVEMERIEGDWKVSKIRADKYL